MPLESVDATIRGCFRAFTLGRNLVGACCLREQQVARTSHREPQHSALARNSRLFPWPEPRLGSESNNPCTVRTHTATCCAGAARWCKGGALTPTPKPQSYQPARINRKLSTAPWHAHLQRHNARYPVPPPVIAAKAVNQIRGPVATGEHCVFGGHGCMVTCLRRYDFQTKMRGWMRYDFETKMRGWILAYAEYLPTRA